MEKKLLNIKQSAQYLDLNEVYFRNVISNNKYEELKTKKTIIGGKTFFNVEDLLRVKKN